MKYIASVLWGLCFLLAYVNVGNAQDAREVVVFNVIVYEEGSLVPATNIDVVTNIYDTTNYSFTLRTQDNGITPNIVVMGGSHVEVLVQSGCARNNPYFVLPMDIPDETVLTVRAYVEQCVIYGPLLYKNDTK